MAAAHIFVGLVIATTPFSLFPNHLQVSAFVGAFIALYGLCGGLWVFLLRKKVWQKIQKKNF